MPPSRGHGRLWRQHDRCLPGASALSPSPLLLWVVMMIMLVLTSTNDISGSDPDPKKYPASCAEAQTVDGLVTLYWQHNPSQPWSCSCFEGREYLRVNPILNWSFMKCGGGYSGTDLTTRFEGVRLDPHTGFVDRDDIAMAKTTTLMPSVIPNNLKHYLPNSHQQPQTPSPESESDAQPPQQPDAQAQEASSPSTSTLASTTLGSFSSSFARCGDRTYMPLGSAGDCVGMYQAHGQMQIDISDSPFRFTSTTSFSSTGTWAAGASMESLLLRSQAALVPAWGGWCGFVSLVSEPMGNDTTANALFAGLRFEYGPTCAGFSCDAGRRLKASPNRIFCAGDICSADQCCEATSVCPFDFECGVGKILKTNPGSITCRGTRCSVAECCHKTTTCTADFACGLGRVLRPNPTAITCAKRHCALAECCFATSTCGNFRCGSGRALKANPAAITCAAKRCTTSECCEDVGRFAYAFTRGKAATAAPTNTDRPTEKQPNTAAS